MIARELAIAISDTVTRLIERRASRVMVASWQSEETVDDDLSVIHDGTDVHRFVPKLSSVGALTYGDLIVLVKAPGVPLTIIGRMVGDISLAEV